MNGLTGRELKKNPVVAIEIFLSTGAKYALENGNGWTFITGDGRFVAQHEHARLVTDGTPVILTAANKIWN